MISQYEVPAILKEEIPELALKPCPSRFSIRTFTFINYFSGYTMHAIEQHDLIMAKKCFTLAEALWQQGDRVVRMLIENIFIYSLSAVMPHSRTERGMLRSLIPASLYNLYLKQVMSAGC